VNTIEEKKIGFGDLIRIRSQEDFSNFLIGLAVEQYCSWRKKNNEPLGKVLAICATNREAIMLPKFPFDKIVLTGIHDQTENLRPYLDRDHRVEYRVENAEKLSFENAEYDLVFCKSGLHHLARPVQGLYEMLRVCNSAAIFIEPFETPLSNVLDRLNLRSKYERQDDMNIEGRDNYVFRWQRRLLEQLLNSYYLESGYKLDIVRGWMSSRYNAHDNGIVRMASSVAGFLASNLPGCGGNQIICTINPGMNLPPN